MVRTLVKQFVSQLGAIPSALQELYEDCTGRSITHPELSVLVDQLLATCLRFDRVYVILDALDECEDSNQETILEMVHGILTQPSVRVLLTSRLYLPVVQPLLRKAICMSIEARDGDIRTFLRARLERVSYLSQELKHQIVDVIAKGAEGMYVPMSFEFTYLLTIRFLLVELQLSSVLSEKEPRKLEAALHGSSLPKTPENAYQQILDRIARDSTEVLVFKILSWVFHSREPLQMTELREALVIEVGDAELLRKYFLEPAVIVEVCRCLITHDEASGIVQFTHTTVQHFLQSLNHPAFLTLVELSKRLLTYLSFETFKNPCRDDSELKRRMEKFSLCNYAACWWPSYVRGNGEVNMDVQHLLFTMFNSPRHVESVLQIAETRVTLPAGMTLLHFATFHQLTLICQLIVSGNSTKPNVLRDVGNERKVASRGRMNDVETNVRFPKQSFGDIDDRDGNDETPLHVAAKLGFDLIVGLLINAGADVNARSGKSVALTPLHLAVIGGHEDVVQRLLEAQAEPDAKGQYWGETPLLLASLFGHHNTLKQLLGAKSNVDAIVDSGKTAIMWAMSSPSAYQVVQSLIRAGANINARDHQGRVAIHYALHLLSFRACKQMLKLFISSGADLNSRSYIDGNTLLHALASINLQYELNLKKTKLRISTPFINDLYAQRCAIKFTSMPKDEEVEGADEVVEIVKLLLEHGADGRLRNSDGDTPLQCAIKSRNPAAFILLKAVGGTVNFIMERLGDQGFLDALERLVAENTESD